MTDAPLQPLADPRAAAGAARLRYIADSRPGIRRKRAGAGFTYIAPDGRPIREAAERARIRALGIPPAWTDVWISPLPNSHIQATGRDARGRKQYRYHARWRAVRDETKYARLAAFGRALPAIRRQVDADLRRPGLPRERVLGAVIRLLETTLIRVGNDEYARENHHYGLTTLHNRHAEVEGARIRFRFTGKSGKRHEVEIEDARLARLVRRLQDLPGYSLFEYLDESGEPVAVGSEDVNAYLREIAGEDFSAKDFRTWAGTVLAYECLAECPQGVPEAECRRYQAEAVKEVAARLGNTAAVCRKAYIHPAVFEAHAQGGLPAIPEQPEDGLSGVESAVLRLLERAEQRRG